MGSFGTVIKSLYLSGLRVKSLTMRMVEWSFPLHSVPDGPCLNVMAKTLGGLKHMKLNVWFDDDEDPKHAEDFAKLLAGCKNLETLQLDVRDGCEDYQFAEDYMDQEIFVAYVLQQTFGGSLRKLTITGSVVKMAGLVNFLERADTDSGITEFHLENVHVEGWEAFSQHAETISLEVSLSRHVQTTSVSCTNCTEQEEDDEEE